MDECAAIFASNLGRKTHTDAMCRFAFAAEYLPIITR